MNRKLSSTIISMALALPIQALAWSHEYLEADRADQISTCNASVVYRDGWFTVRLYGDEMDFVFHRQDFTLPYSTLLGPVSFKAANESFVLLAETFSRSASSVVSTSQTMYITALKSDYARLFDALRNGSNLEIQFPNGDVYYIGLNGSARALNAASACWEGRPTGPLQNNPFSPESGQNPFEVPENSSSNPFDSL